MPSAMSYVPGFCWSRPFGRRESGVEQEKRGPVGQKGTLWDLQYFSCDPMGDLLHVRPTPPGAFFNKAKASKCPGEPPLCDIPSG